MFNLIAKGGAVLTLSNLTTTSASFVRNIIVARIIGVEDFGIASLLALAMFVVEMVSDLAVNKVIIQDSEGNRNEFLGSGHSFQVIRGIVSGLAIYWLAGPISAFFGIPQTQWAFETLALVPLLRGFVHLDLSRLQRDMHFVPVALAESIPQLVTLILAWPLALMTKDYSAMVWLILVQNLLYLSLSHYFSERSFSLAWDVHIVKRIFRFGWPLLLNGLLMFIILQGDKVIVGKFFDMEVLGWYSAAFGLALAPAMLVMKVSYALLLPIMSRVKEDQSQFALQSENIIQLSLIIGIAYTAIFSLIGSFLLTLLFGEDFAEGAYLVTWLCFMQGIRIAKFGPFGSALSNGTTRIPLIANIARSIAFFVAIVALINGATVLHVVLIGLAGEAMAYWLGLLLLSRAINIKILGSFTASFILWCLVLFAIVFDWKTDQNPSWGGFYAVTLVIWLGVLVLTYKLLPRGAGLIALQLKNSAKF